MRHRVFGLVSFLLVGPASLPAQSQPLLRELPAVGVHVVGITALATRLGVDGTDLVERTERALRAAGFEVPAAASLADHPETPRLIVNVGIFTPDDSSAVYSVTLELMEQVQLMRNGLATHAIGWSEQILGLTRAPRSGPAARQAVDQLVAMFVAQSRQATLGMR